MVSPGDTIGHYVVEAPITEGGMGAIYRARNRVTGQLRALKVVRPELAKDVEFVDRFVREATIASQLRHPNLVETLEPGIDGETIFLPMELLEGETLFARLRRGRFEWQDAVAILTPIAEAVQLLHDRGVIHRDLKPANIFLARVAGGGEVPKVLDFGIARKVDDDEHTQTGMVIGSPYYMSLEQAEGRRDMDGRTDQYALAVIAYEMVTGRRPYESDDTQSALAKLLRGEQYPPPTRVVPDAISPTVERAILRGLARKREDRFPTIGAFASTLAAATAASATEEVRTVVIPAPEPAPTRLEVAPARRSSLLPAILAVGGLAAALVIGTTVLAWTIGDDTEPAERAAPTIATESAIVATQEAPAEPPAAERVEAPAPPVERATPPIATPPVQPASEPPAAPQARRATTSVSTPRRPAKQRALPEAPFVEEDCGALTGIPCTHRVRRHPR